LKTGLIQRIYEENIQYNSKISARSYTSYLLTWLKFTTIMKTFYKISGVVFVIGCLFFLKNVRELIETYHSGHFVNVTVVYVPNCITTKAHYNIKFTYNGNTYAKQIGVLSCRELNVGDTIRLKTNKDNSVFLYESENPYNDRVYTIILLLFGIFLIYMGFKK